MAVLVAGDTVMALSRRMYPEMLKLRKTSAQFIALLLLQVTSVGAQQAHYQKHDSVLLPDDTVTPGQVAIHDTQKVCSTKWGLDALAVTEAMKIQVYSRYGVVKGKGICKLVSHKDKNGKTVTRGCEIDHRISRDVGGADVLENLWPQPYLTPTQPGAFQKDKLEVWLNKQVCAHSITLDEAQQTLAGDWYAAYLKAGLDK
jgi:hypothetical protein